MSAARDGGHLLLLAAGWVVLVVVSLLLAIGPEDDRRPDGSEQEVWTLLESGEDVIVRLEAREEHLKVLAHLEVPDPGTADEERTWRFGLGLTYEPANGTPVEQEYWTRSRRTLLEDGSDAVQPLRAGTVITDSRILELEPGHLLPQGGLLRIRPLFEQPDQRLLLRVYRQDEVIGSRRLVRLQRPGRETLGHLARSHPYGWDALAPEERLGLASVVQERLPAEGSGSDSVTIRRLGAPSPAPTVAPQGTVLQPGQGTVVNLLGPATLNVASEMLAPDGSLVKGVPLVAELVDASPGAVDDSLITAHRVEVPPGAIWSLRWVNPWDQPPVTLRFGVVPETGRSWGAPPGAAAEQPLGPELRRITTFHVDEGLTPVEVAVATGGIWGSLAVEAWPWPSEEWVADPTADVPVPVATIRYTTLDEDGKELGQGSFQAPFTYSPFERYVETATPWVSEPTFLHLFHPFKAATIQFEADRPVDLRLLAPVEVEPERAPEYGLPEGWRGRYAPWEMARFVALRPLNLPELVADRRLVRFDATVRIEPAPVTGKARRHTRELPPPEKLPRYALVERFPWGGARWQPWHRTRLGETTRLDIPADGDLRVDYRVPPGAVGGRARLACGASSAAVPLPASAGILDFRGLVPGRQECTLEAPEGAFLARAAGSGERWARRTVYRADGREFHLPVETRHDQHQIVYIRTYTVNGDPAPEVEVRVDGGQPRRHGAAARLLTPPRQAETPPRAGVPARLEDRERGEVVAWEGVRVVLGDDLVPGPHTLTVRASAGGEPVWIRFEATDVPTTPDPPEHWVREVRCEIRR